MSKKLITILILINICFSLEYSRPIYLTNLNIQSPSELTIQTEDFHHLVAIMVDFQVERETFEDLNNNGYWDISEPFNDINGNGIIDYYDYNDNSKYDQYLIDGKLYYEDYDNPKTSGLGQFLLNNNQLNYNLESFDDRCDGFIVDNVPHNRNYFLNQLMAIKNYYNSISNSLIDFEVHVIDSVYTVQEQMSYYSESDANLGELFSESLTLGKNDIEDYLSTSNIDVDDVLFIVFHAGLGQDFSVPFLDPTTQDLKSAYIDSDMLDVFNLPVVNNVSINKGILLPETQNFIFYDVVEDIFPELKNIGYCDVQVGLTGTFAFLLGYGYNLNPMFLSNGMSGIGKFGLMDYGSNNGRGVIPSPPNPWTRIKIAEKYPNSQNLVNNIKESGIYTLKPRHETDMIYRINISDSEYYLIENRNNSIVAHFDLEFLQLLYGDEFLCNNCGLGCDGINVAEINENTDLIDECIKNYSTTAKHNYFDLLSSLISADKDSVISNISNYDYGLPGSGLLIWHVDENIINQNLNDLSDCGSINCIVNHRGIELEEADGSIDIGYNSSHPLFKDHINGWKYDFWYPGNNYYFNYGNPNLSNNDTLFFNNKTTPNTNSNENSESLISLRIISENLGEISFKVDFNENYESIILSDTTIQVVGGGVINNEGNIFYILRDSLYQHNKSEIINIGQADINKKILVYNDSYDLVDLESNSLVYWNPTLEQTIIDPDPFISGYYNSSEDLDILRDSDFSVANTSLGDLDSDGMDELIFSDYEGSLIVKNYNETYVNGFPMKGNFYGTPIIANIIDVDDNVPEIICREDDSIVILSSNGERILRIASLNPNNNLRIIPDWDNNKAALVDGNRIILFNYDHSHSYWLSEYSTSYDYPVSQNQILYPQPSLIQSSYNYPNPISRGHTTFRFYIQDENTVDINIYNIHGLSVKSFHMEDLVQNEYNEIEWNNIKNLSPGLYYAEVIFDNRDTELIKLAIIQ